MYGAPSSSIYYDRISYDPEDPNDHYLKDFRKSMKCIDGVFGEMVGEYKGLDKLHIEIKAHIEETSLQLDECEKIENPKSKKQ